MLSLRGWRESKLMSQAELAKKAKMAISTVCRLEKGRQKPRFATIKKMARALKVDPKEIKF